MRALKVLAALVLVLFTGLSQADGLQLASRPADEWIKSLESPTRIAGLRLDDVIARLGLTPGQVVVDVGAGAGVFSLPLARAVGPSGKVYAVEIESAFVEHIARKSKAEGLPNVLAVLGTFSDPRLPATDVDLAFIHDVLHHIEDRSGYLKNLTRYLKPTARVAIIDFLPDKGGHQDQPALQVSSEQAAGLMAQAGFKPIEQIALFDEKWFVVYGR
jgi:ubiquinone/menaquinone biosynthesis C-methylase UbiE